MAKRKEYERQDKKKAEPKEEKKRVFSRGGAALKAAVREDEITERKRKAKPIVIPPPWSPVEHKPEYLEMLRSEKNKARLKLSGQLLAVMHGQTEEKDGDPIPGPLQNLGTQLVGIVEQIATKAAIAELGRAKEIYERERQRLMGAAAG